MQTPDFDNLMPVSDAIQHAPTPADAARVVVDWLQAQGIPAAAALLEADSMTLSAVSSAEFGDEASLIQWMYANPDWRQWRVPQLASETHWMIPMVSGGQPYGLLAANGEVSATGFVLVNLLAARISYLIGTAQWNAKLEAINELTLSLSEIHGEDGWNLVYDQMNALFEGASFYIALCSRSERKLELPVVAQDGMRVDWSPIPLCGLSGAVIRYATPLLFRDLERETERLQSLGVEPCDDEPGQWARSWLGVPMRNRTHELIGLVSVQSVVPNSFGDQDLMLLMAVASQIAMAVENLSLLESERERRAIASTLIDIGQVVSATLDFDEVLQLVLEQFRRVLDYDNACMFLPLPGIIDGSRMMARAVHGLNVDLRGKDLHLHENSPVALVYESKQPMVLQNALEHPGWQRTLTSQSHMPRAWIGAPMLVQDRVIGVITIDKFSPGFYDERDASTAFALARHAAIAVENARLHAQTQANVRALQERTRRLTLMQRIAALITSTLDYDTVLSSAAQSMTELFDIDHCAIALLDERSNSVRVTTEYPNRGMTGYELSYEGAAALERLSEKQHSLIEVDNEHNAPDEMSRRLIEQTGARSSLIMPLNVRDKVIGLLTVSKIERQHPFADDEREAFESIAGQIALAVNNAELYKQAVAANSLKNEFLATISHELRTPLNAVIGYSEMLLDGIYGTLNERQTDRMQRVTSSARHLLALINDVLDLSKIEAGQMSLESAPMYLSDLLPGVFSQIRLAAEAKGLALHTYVHPNEQRIVGDADRLRQVLLNLLNNAIKFTHQGDITVSITPYSQQDGIGIGTIQCPSHVGVTDGDWVALSVRDTGIGIKPEDQELIFEVFRQVDGSSVREYGGSGLGLAITRQLVALHNGHVWVESELGRGSTFHVLLPCAVPNRNLLASLHQEGRELLLVVDNDRAGLQLVQDYLGVESFEIIGTSSPAQALELARRLQPAAIITDLMMPTMDGWDLLRALKANDDTAHIPVIVLSIVERKAMGFFMGAADYLMKPLRREDLLESLGRVLRMSPNAPILIVDDGADDRTLLKEWLQRGGYSVEMVNSGEAALQWLHRQPASLILLDLFLPGMSGFDLLAQLRRDAFTAEIPVIVVTSHALDEKTRTALNAELTQVLQKSTMSGTTLLEQVYDALNHRRYRSRST